MINLQENAIKLKAKVPELLKQFPDAVEHNTIRKQKVNQMIDEVTEIMFNLKSAYNSTTPPDNTTSGTFHVKTS